MANAEIESYLAGLPDDRRAALTVLREQILKALPKGYEEAFNWGMITYQVPLSVYPDTYNKQPLMFAALASQKNYMSLYLMCAYIQPGGAEALQQAFKDAGKKLDMGRSCIRFKRLDDLTLPPILQLIQSTPMDDFVAHAKAVRVK